VNGVSPAGTDDLVAFPPLEWAEQDPSNCSIGLTVDLVGDKWALLILRELVFGIDRFDAVQSHLGISRRTLAERLGALVSHGLVVREPITVAGQRSRHRYVLTPAGVELIPVIVALREWGDRHRPEASPPPVALLHAECGGSVSIQFRCEHGHDVDAPQGMRVARGPGAVALVAEGGA
jgi:DNA-binding HxlR family transcriptional regulator